MVRVVKIIFAVEIMETVRLPIEDSGNIEQIAISIQNIEKILKDIRRELRSKNAGIPGKNSKD